MPTDVLVAYLHPNEVGHNFLRSYLGMALHDVSGDRRIVTDLAMRCGATGDVEARSDARNKVAAEFLDTTAEWLLWLDADMGFAPDTLDRLLASADPQERPIVGALCFAWRETILDGMGGYRCEPRPTIFDWVDTPAGPSFMGRTSFPPDELVRCAGTGSACVLIHRSVFERIKAAHGPTWYDRIKGSDGSWIGEDTSFCVRAGAVDAPVHVHTGVRTNHLKDVWVSDVDWGQLMAPRTARKAKVVAVMPVRDRRDLTRHILPQLVEQCDHVVVVDNGSTDGTREWLRKQPVEVITEPERNIHLLWNRGIDAALRRSPTAVAIVNNDLDLGPNALRSCADVLAAAPQLAAVSPNYDGRDLPVDAVQAVDGICAGRYDGTGGLAGFCMVVDAGFLSSYRFPEACTWWYGDNDLVLSIKAAGRQVGIVGAATVEHLDGGGQTGHWDDPAMQAVLDADREAFLAKWSPAHA